jgi:hypothetical protein
MYMSPSSLCMYCLCLIICTRSVAFLVMKSKLAGPRSGVTVCGNVEYAARFRILNSQVLHWWLIYCWLLDSMPQCIMFSVFDFCFCGGIRLLIVVNCLPRDVLCTLFDVDSCLTFCIVHADLLVRLPIAPTSVPCWPVSPNRSNSFTNRTQLFRRYAKLEAKLN